MPRYQLPNGKIVFSEKEIPDSEMDAFVSEMMDLDVKAEPKVAPTEPTPITTKQPEKPNILKQAWDVANTPIIDAPSRGGRQISEEVFQPLRKKVENPFLASVMGFAEGAQEGLGDIASSLTSPLNLITTALTGGSGALATKTPALARILGMGARGLSASVAAHGAVNVAHPESTLMERGTGLAELAGGVAGMGQKLPQIGKNIADDIIPENIDLPLSQAEIPVVKTIETPAQKLADEIIANKAIPPEIPEPKPQYPIIEFPKKPVNLIRDDKPNLILDTKRGVFIEKTTGEEIPLNDPRLKPSKPFVPFKSDPSDQIPLFFESNKPPTVPFQKLREDLTQAQLDADLLIPPRLELGKEGASAVKAIMSAIDLPPLRQGLPAILTKGWWTSWDDMVKSYGSQKAYELSQESIKSDPLFRNYQAAGGTFTDQLLNPEDQWVSKILSKNIPGTKFNPLRGGQRGSITFLNKMRFDNWKGMYNRARDASLLPGLTAEERIASNPATNEVLARQFADFVNDTSGRGSLDFSRNNPKSKANLEKISGYLNAGFWSPHLISSRVRLFNRYFNPIKYAEVSPEIRKQTLKSLLGVVGTWGTTAGLLSQIPGAELSLDPTSSDFGKVKIGNYRQDFSGAFQPYLVAASKLVSGLSTSPISGDTQETGQEFGGQTREGIIEQFGINKAAPLVNFVYDILNASKQRPFNVLDRSVQMVVPMMVEDLIAILKEDPKLLPMLIPSLIGSASQTYGQGDRGEGKIIPRSWDWQITGGSPWR